MTVWSFFSNCKYFLSLSQTLNYKGQKCKINNTDVNVWMFCLCVRMIIYLYPLFCSSDLEKNIKTNKIDLTTSTLGLGDTIYSGTSLVVKDRLVSRGCIRQCVVPVNCVNSWMDPLFSVQELDLFVCVNTPAMDEQEKVDLLTELHKNQATVQR